MAKTFYELSPISKAKWERRAGLCAEIAWRSTNGNIKKTWKKDEILGHMQALWEQENQEWAESHEGSNFKKLRMASIFGGANTPTLDLVNLDYRDCAYRWLREGEIPLGSLRHNLSISVGFTRPAFDYFNLLAKSYDFDKLLDSFTAELAMKLLLDVEFYVRINRANEFNDDLMQEYLSQIHTFKREVQNRITMSEAIAFNEMTAGLQLGTGG